MALPAADRAPLEKRASFITSSIRSGPPAGRDAPRTVQIISPSSSLSMSSTPSPTISSSQRCILPRGAPV